MLCVHVLNEAGNYLINTYTGTGQPEKPKLISNWFTKCEFIFSQVKHRTVVSLCGNKLFSVTQHTVITEWK